MSGVLESLRRELLSLDKKSFLSIRQKKRRETVVRQIAIAKQQLENRLRRREEKAAQLAHRRQRVAEAKAERKLFRAQERKRWKKRADEEKILRRQLQLDGSRKRCEELQEFAKARKAKQLQAASIVELAPSKSTKRAIKRRCFFCGRPVHIGKRRFCNKHCRRAANRLPTPEHIQLECEKISATWSAAEEVTRSNRGPNKRTHLAAKLIERHGRQIPTDIPAAEVHDFIYHGRGPWRADNDYWNQELGG